MNNEKELENTIIDKITEVMDTYNVEYLLLRSNVTGDLKDYLKALDDEQLDIVARCYYTEEEIKEKGFSKLRELLDNKIKEKFMEIILPMPYSQYKNIEALAHIYFQNGIKAPINIINKTIGLIISLIK